ncbi:MAG: RagB/SusD family nutrient uptake outer membrane protein [Gemmatimonadales bacterium]|nr:RagB/SusD family nutrient uptake outer membrane protein [Gemmatimonadales bacterium]
MTATNSPRTLRLWRGLMIFPVALLLGGLLVGCESLLDVDNPAAVTADFLEQPENAPLLVESAVADFECAFGQYIAAGGLIGNELWDGQLGAALWPYDRRSFDESGGLYATTTCSGATGQWVAVYQSLSTAVQQADYALEVIEAGGAEVPNAAALTATAHAYGGYGRLLLGEGMCSAAINGGPELTSQEIFALAEAELTAAMTGGGSDITNMALVGRARARLNQGNTAGALDDAQAVPAGFRMNAAYSSASGRSANKIYRHSNRFEFSSIEDNFHNLSWKGVADPRVDVTDQGRLTAGDDLTPFWTQNKYTSEDSPIPIARWAEAQLIIAEVQGGTTAVNIINALHTAAGLPAYDPATDGPILDHIMQERERELFLESHHLYDIIRFNKPLHPAVGTPYQETGAKGGSYGSVTCLPLPLVERDNNPNIP